MLCPDGGFALALWQGAALGCMVGLMSYGKRQFEELDPIMRKLIPPFHQAMDELVAMVDADSRAFSSYMVRSHREQWGSGELSSWEGAIAVPWCSSDQGYKLGPSQGQGK